jgi:hypothetical protein
VKSRLQLSLSYQVRMTENKVITCRAAVCWAANEPLSVEEVQVDPPKAGEARVKIIASGIVRIKMKKINKFNNENELIYLST